MSQSPARLRVRPLRWVPLLLPLGLLVAGLPATAAQAEADGLVSGTVTFHESRPDRTLEVYREGPDHIWAADESRTTTVAPDGSFTVHVPADEPVKLRVSFGSSLNNYFYGDVFTGDVAPTVQAAAGTTVAGVDLTVPVPVPYSGRLVDRSGHPVAGSVIPSADTDGFTGPIVSAPIPVGASGEYSVFLPARSGGVYEDSILGSDELGDAAWLRGGTGTEPDWFVNPLPGENHTGQDITLPIGSSATMPATKPSQQSASLRVTRSPHVRGALVRGHRLHTTIGAYNRRPSTVRYQWLRNGRPIHGARSATYRLRRADVRKHISVRVTAYRDGSTVRATSARSAAVRAD